MNGEEINMRGNDGKEYIVIRNGGGMKVTLTNVLQLVIVAALSIMGWVFADAKKTINTMDGKVDQITIDQALIKKELIQNTEEHEELKALIKQSSDN
jgi:hypothetical protein